jgi:hypothetical protein
MLLDRLVPTVCRKEEADRHLKRVSKAIMDGTIRWDTWLFFGIGSIADYPKPCISYKACEDRSPFLFGALHMP